MPCVQRGRPPVCGISPIYSGGCCTSVLDLSYSFTNASGQNNGNVQRINNNLNMERTQLFTYDSLNRLSTAYTASTNQPWWQGDNPLLNCWGEQYTYDPWGNFTAISPVSTAYTGCSQESLSMSSTTKNQLEDTNGDYIYDAAGNLTQPGPIGGPYVYDNENHLTSADGVTYTYDGDGNRVMKSNGTIYWYGANDASLEESDLSGNLQRLYYFFNGQRIGRQLTTNEVGFYMTDALGSVRYLGGSATSYSFDYFPFGAPILDSDTGDDRYQFTGKERDSESGLDNFGARYDSSNLGRWTSPDLPFADQNPDNPQSWNLYGYVRNNPLNSIDTNGRVTWLIGGTWYNPHDWDPSSDIGQEMAGFFDPNDPDVETIPWSGGNSASARADLAARIVEKMKAHGWKPGEQNNIVCHSHGCNGVMAALGTLMNDGYFVDNLVTLGEPMRGDYRFTPGSVDAWWNVYNPHDLVQRLGGRIPFFGGRTNPAATNIRVNSGRGPIGNHSALHNDYLTRLMWELAIRDAQQQQPDSNPDPPNPAGRTPWWPF